MNRKNILVVLLTLALCSFAFAGKPVELRMKDGARWRGEVGQTVDVTFKQSAVDVPMTGTLLKVEDSFIVVKGSIAGVDREKVIFKADLVSMKTVGAASTSAPTSSSPTPNQDPKSDDKSAESASAAPVQQPGKPMGVFLLPLSGMVGEGFRTQEMEAIAREADKIGPGQIIVLRINSGGGLAIEMERIHYTLLEIKKRHRVVAWIEEAISAAAATAGNCDEIYFMTEGNLGAMTMFAGGVAAQGEELRKWMDTAARIFEAGGRSKFIAWAMIDEKALLSYDKDPVTGEVRWYNDLSGEYDLSDDKTNLTFTSSTAMHCNFADGIADTEEDLAKLLNLPKWVELGNGRKIAEDWLKTVEKAKVEIPHLFEQFQYKNASNPDPRARLGTRIQIIEKLIKWWERAPNVCLLTGVPPKSELERQLAELRKQVSDINKDMRR
jgi:hypothetical protein